MVDTIYVLLFLLGVPFFAYGIYYLIVGISGYRKHTKFNQHAPENRMCAVIAARNESLVIGNLIDTLKEQNYPEDLFDIYVIPNNCTDNTEEVARKHGAKIFHCTSEVRSRALL